MKILSFSYCFPNSDNPNWGIFVFHRISALARLETLQVYSPVPWFPFLAGKQAGDTRENWNGLDVFRPKFFYTPKILKNQDARFYAKGIKHYVADLCRDWRPDILDAHFVWPDGVGVSRIARELGIPYVITLRGKLYECIKIASQKQQCADALKNAAAVISVSSRLADEAIQLGVDKDRIFIIPNGVDKDTFQIRNKKAWRRELGLPLNKKLLVTVAHLGHRKGHHEVIQVLARLPEDVFLVLVGGAAQDGSPEIIMKMAKSSGVENRVMLAGPQPYDRVAQYFSAADASVLASYREGCPNVVLESLACGTPVVATDVGAVRDILPVPDAGRIVPPQEKEPLKIALAEVIGQEWDPEAVQEKSGVRSWDQVAIEVEKVFNKIIKF